MKRTVIVAIALVMMLGGIGIARTIVWGSELKGSVPMEYADAAYAACPEDGYPEAGNALTPCQELWWNDGDPNPGGF